MGLPCTATLGVALGRVIWYRKPLPMLNGFAVPLDTPLRDGDVIVC